MNEKVAEKVESERLVIGWWLLLVVPAALVWLGLAWLGSTFLGGLSFVIPVLGVVLFVCVESRLSKFRSSLTVVLWVSFVLAFVASVLVPSFVSAHDGESVPETRQEPVYSL